MSVFHIFLITQHPVLTLRRRGNNRIIFQINIILYHKIHDFIQRDGGRAGHKSGLQCSAMGRQAWRQIARKYLSFCAFRAVPCRLQNFANSMRKQIPASRPTTRVVCYARGWTNTQHMSCMMSTQVATANSTRLRTRCVLLRRIVLR